MCFMSTLRKDNHKLLNQRLFKLLCFCLQGTVFDYYLCNDSKKWVTWTEKVPNFELDSEVPLQVWSCV